MDSCLSATYAIPRLIWTVLAVTLLTNAQNLPDNRCYLENGASSESFFVSEDLPIGSTIGQIRIHGDPRPGGTIALHLRETDSPVIINPGSRNLTLKRRLDKEGINGPSSVFINLICERLHTIDPGFVIPINIRVTDANDNAPKFINAPYILNISEVTVVGTRVLQGVHAVDADQQGPFSSVRYSVLPGLHADYFEFENELEGTLVLRKSLDYESLRSFDIGIRAQDHGEPPKFSDTILSVHVIDADDQNPRFLDERYSAILQEPPLKSTPLIIKPRSVKAYDQDLGINAPVHYTFNSVGSDYAFFKINRVTGLISLNKDLLSNELRHPATLVIRATQQDNPDRYALATLTVSRATLENEIRFVRPVFYVKTSEMQPVGTTITMLGNTKSGEHLQYFVSDKDILNTFTISPKGEILLKSPLDYERRSDYIFRVFATDGISNDSCVVNVTVEDVNEWEPHFRYSHYEFFVSGMPEELIGIIEVGDGDIKDKLTLSLTGVNASLFFITSNGELRLQKVKEYQGSANLAVMASDNGKPPKTASVPVIVHFERASGIGGFVTAGRINSTGSILLAVFGTVLLLLALIIAVLVVYICKGKKSTNREELPNLESDRSSTSTGMEKTNPMFGDLLRSPTASAMGGLPSGGDGKTKPSTKIYPAPQPPVWPHASMSSRSKKLSWNDDKNNRESAENIHIIDVPHKLTDNSNLTVYF